MNSDIENIADTYKSLQSSILQEHLDSINKFREDCYAEAIQHWNNHGHSIFHRIYRAIINKDLTSECYNIKFRPDNEFKNRENIYEEKCQNALQNFLKETNSS